MINTLFLLFGLVLGTVAHTSSIANISLQDLQPYNVNINETSASGISSGGYMAVQLHYAFSTNIKATAVFAGGPYLCAGWVPATALTACMSMPWIIVPFWLEMYTKWMYDFGFIDNLQNIKGSKVFLYSGSEDTVVAPGVVMKLEDIYRHYGAEVTTQYDITSEHCWPTDDYGVDCDQLKKPYICNCGYNGAEHAFGVMFDDLKDAVEPVEHNLIKFSQGKYTGFLATMEEYGFAYIPTACQNGEKCKIHISLHGCDQTLEEIGSDWVTKTQINGIAEANNIIVLYPQAKKSWFPSFNIKGCWDWWGYTGTMYPTKKGSQPKAIWKMVLKLAGIGN